MSFRDDEVFEAFAEATGGKREFFGSDGYSFHRLGKLDRLDQRLLDRLKVARWRQRNRALLDSSEFRAAAAARARAWLAAQMANPETADQVRVKAAKRGQRYRERHADEAWFIERRRAADRRKYERQKADPERWAKLRQRRLAAQRAYRSRRRAKHP